MDYRAKPHIRKVGDYEWICQSEKNAFLCAIGFNPRHAFQQYVRNAEEFAPKPREPDPPFIIEYERKWETIANPKPWWKFW